MTPPQCQRMPTRGNLNQGNMTQIAEMHRVQKKQRESIIERYQRRRYVWKDADHFDITCVVASPCSTRILSIPTIQCKPVRRHNATNTDTSNVPSHTTSNGTSTASTTPKLHTTYSKGQHSRLPKLGQHDSNALPDEEFVASVLATVDDEEDGDDEGDGDGDGDFVPEHFKIFSRPTQPSTRKIFEKKSKSKSNPNSSSNPNRKRPSLTPSNNEQRAMATRSIQSPFRSPMSSSNPRSGRSTPRGHMVNKNQSLDISGGPLGGMRVSTKIPKMKLEMIQSGGSMKPKQRVLQHFDLKGIQTLLFDGILCTIQKTARFQTLRFAFNSM